MIGIFVNWRKFLGSRDQGRHSNDQEDTETRDANKKRSLSSQKELAFSIQIWIYIKNNVNITVNYFLSNSRPKDLNFLRFWEKSFRRGDNDF